MFICLLTPSNHDCPRRRDCTFIALYIDVRRLTLVETVELDELEAARVVL